MRSPGTEVGQQHRQQSFLHHRPPSGRHFLDNRVSHGALVGGPLSGSVSRVDPVSPQPASAVR